jgi:3-deoxy-D-manno-octulosonic-acid transferase
VAKPDRRLQSRKVPVVLANARACRAFAAQSAAPGKLIADAARGITLVAAQTQDDAERVRRWACDVEITGSIKFDVVVPEAALAIGAALRAPSASVPCCCAPAREGEES